MLLFLIFFRDCTKNSCNFSALKGNVKTASTSPTKNSTFQKHTVDHRPTRILVSGYEGDEQESVLQHFGVCLIILDANRIIP